jgi:carbonic anhydrase
MHDLHILFDNTREWAARNLARDPEFCARLVRQQAPDYLWIGCSDSRVPANEIVGLLPGELFVHRNVANVVVHTDLNCLSVMQFAVEALKVKHIIVTGHYGCGGVRAAMLDARYGLIDNWLRNVQDVARKHSDLLNSISDENERLDRLCELNVIEQVARVCETTIVRTAWEEGQELTVHGWIYSIENGRLRDLGICAGNLQDVERQYAEAVNLCGDDRIVNVRDSLQHR